LARLIFPNVPYIVQRNPLNISHRIRGIDVAIYQAPSMLTLLARKIGRAQKPGARFLRDLRGSNIHGARIWQYPLRRVVLSVRIASIFARCVTAVTLSRDILITCRLEIVSNPRYGSSFLAKMQRHLFVFPLSLLAGSPIRSRGPSAGFFPEPAGGRNTQLENAERVDAITREYSSARFARARV